MMTEEIPENVQRWTAKRRTALAAEIEKLIRHIPLTVTARLGSPPLSPRSQGEQEGGLPRLLQAKGLVLS